jgi:hypothetical protein
MLSTISRKNLFRHLISERAFSPTGFSLIEPVISSVLLLISAIQIATLFDINMRAIANSHALDAADIEIHAVIDKVRNLGTSYNWCANSGSTIAANCSNYYLETNPQGYYSPAASSLDNFLSKCRVVATAYQPHTDQIVANLATSLNSLSNADPKNGVKIVAYFEDERIRRFKIAFHRTIQINGQDRDLTRWLYLVPDLANWCPN